MKDIRSQFPIFENHPNLVYFDSAASTQTPQIVLDAMEEYYKKYRANIHRGLYDLSMQATEAYENARAKVAHFINAQREEIVFTSGTTHGLNLLASSLANNLLPGDNIVLTRYEHHANLIPWQKIAEEKHVELRFIDIVHGMEETDGDEVVFSLMKGKTPVPKLSGTFEIDLESAQKLIDEKTKIVSFGLVSNTLGTIAPAKEIIALAKKFSATTIIDAAQAVAHIPIDVRELDVDFLVFSSHKMYGPTGIGVLYGKKSFLEKMPPYFLGGDMVKEVSYEKASWAEVPMKFEGGTPNIAGAIGLGAAVDFIDSIGWQHIEEHEKMLTKKLLENFASEKITVVGTPNLEKRIGVVSFTIDDIHPHDVAEILNRGEVCIRAGHHCTMPLMNYLGLPGTNRVSIGIYNSKEDIEKLMEGIKKTKQIFQT